MSVEIIKKETKVVFKRQNETVQVSMHCDVSDWMSSGFCSRIWRKDDSLFLDNQEIKGDLYDLINGMVENDFNGKSEPPHELKLLNFEKPEDDLLNIVKDVFCKGEPFSLRVEYESHLHNLFDCKDCG